MAELRDVFEGIMALNRWNGEESSERAGINAFLHCQPSRELVRFVHAIRNCRPVRRALRRLPLDEGGSLPVKASPISAATSQLR